MDSSSKKRKTEENGTTTTPSPNPNLTPEDLRKIIEPFTQDQLLQIILDTALTSLDVLNAIRSVADSDLSQRKLFIRGLGWDTTTDNIRTLFSSYGELLEAIVVIDKATGKSKGYGFITFKHIDGALLALKEPSKKIDGRVTVTQLASAGGVSGQAVNNNPIGGGDFSMRKVYVANVPFDMTAERILGHFSEYGEIEEGPFGFDKQTGKCKGYALFVYKTSEAARAALVDSTKVIDGHQVVCRYANEGKKGKIGGVEMTGNGLGPVGGTTALAVPLGSISSSQYGVGGFSSYGQQPQQGLMSHHHLSSSGSQIPSSLGSNSGGYGGVPMLPSTYSGLGSYGGPGDGIGSSLYNRLPPSSVGYPESGYFGLPSSAFPGHLHHSSGPSAGPRIPPGGMYHGIPPYY
ncbi:hypothetical protein GIB67_000181 [Kingdonia uniflora]|uniref:RRM domain-containing protein n=1 Tax=Kingdonia uniflora TaxID=39325 RepID=A0A7J7P9I3_9MAGN|nr:hypothetical protein GIB67_000181 [Kingdonia uniflora]